MRREPAELIIDESKGDGARELKWVPGEWKELHRTALSTKEDKALHLTVKTCNQKPYVDIRKHFKHAVSSKWIPTKQGVCLSLDEFRALSKNMGAVIRTLKTVPESASS